MADKTPKDIKSELNLAPHQSGDLQAIKTNMAKVADTMQAQGQSPNEFYRGMRVFSNAPDDPKISSLTKDVGFLAKKNGLTDNATYSAISARLQYDDMGKPQSAGELTFRFKNAAGTECKDITVGVAPDVNGNLTVADQQRKSGVFGATDQSGFNEPQARKVATVECKF